MTDVPLPMDAARSARPMDDASREIALGVAALIAFFGVFLGWAAVAPLDAGVVAPGVVIVSGDRQSVAHRDGGAIARIAVQEGQRVSRGDVLIELAATEVLAREQAMAAEIFDLQLQRAQRLAEAAGRRAIARPREWENLPEQDRALAEEAYARHIAENAARRSARSSQGSGGDVNARIAGYQDQIAAIERQQVLLRDELESMRGLLDEGLVPLPRVRALERNVAELEGRKAEMRSLIAAVRYDQAEGQREIEARIAELTPQWLALQEQLERARIRAPTSGAVVGLAANSIGGVVRPGQTILDIVPDNQPLVIEAHVRPRDADDVHAGMGTQVRITAFSGRATPIMHGVVRRISADRFVDQRTGESYFSAQVEVSAADLSREMAAAGGVGGQLRPGLPAEIVIGTRKRTALDYLIEPLSRTFWRSFREN